MPSMRIVRELTSGLGESVTPNTQFQQSWLLENNGEVAWPQGCYLKLVSEINNDGKMFVPPLAPHDTHIISINLVSPADVGQFKSQFCLCLPHGATFGPIIWSVVDVSIAGTLSLTQQLQQLHTSQQPPKVQPQMPSGWEEDNSMDTGASHNSIITNSTSTALVPHCSNNGISEPFPILVNQVSCDEIVLKCSRITYTLLSEPTASTSPPKLAQQRRGDDVREDKQSQFVEWLINKF
jgi:hypothetical protein